MNATIEQEPRLATEEKICWVVSNGRAGTENQVLGLAEALSHLIPLTIQIKRIAIKDPWGHLPGGLWPDPFSILSPKGHLLRAPYPDIWMAAGRETVPLTIALKKRVPETFTVQTQDPRAPANFFDMIIPPIHDNLRGDNVFPIIGAPSRVNAGIVESLAEEVAERFADMDGPRVAVLLGGSNKSLTMTDHVVAEMCTQLLSLVREGYNLIVSNSRRTRDRHWEIVRARLTGSRVRFVDCRESDASVLYPGLLGLVDAILVSEDSVNMIGEAVTTGKPVYTLELNGKPDKFERFYEDLRTRGAIRKFEGKIDDWQYLPIDETARAAEEIMRRISAAAE